MQQWRATCRADACTHNWQALDSTASTCRPALLHAHLLHLQLQLQQLVAELCSAGMQLLLQLRQRVSHAINRPRRSCCCCCCICCCRGSLLRLGMQGADVGLQLSDCFLEALQRLLLLLNAARQHASSIVVDWRLACCSCTRRVAASGRSGGGGRGLLLLLHVRQLSSQAGDLCPQLLQLCRLHSSSRAAGIEQGRRTDTTRTATRSRNYARHAHTCATLPPAAAPSSVPAWRAA